MGNTIPDIPRLYTAIAEWLSCILLLLLIKPKLPKSLIVSAAALYLGALIVFMEVTTNVVLWLWLPCMLLAFLSMAVFLWFCGRISFYKGVYYAVFAFSTAELMASVEWQVVNFFYADPSQIPIWAEILVLVAVYGMLSFLVYLLYRRQMIKTRTLPISHGNWLAALFIGVVVFGFSNLRFLTDGLGGGYSQEIANIRTLVDVTGTAVLYGHYVSCYNNAVLRELEAVQQTLQTQYQQYKQSRESIDLIHVKYHDLKHQLRIIRSEPDSQKREKYLDSIEDEIKSFELQNKTGNPVLDTILTGKGLYCLKHGITLTSVTDGRLLDFMDVMDICNIFGNALENAIESVLEIKDKEKRLIHVTVSQVNDFVMIRIENYFEGTLKIDGEEFLTTKGSDLYHGYGIKSIKYTANRYDGAVYINAENNWFDLKIAIPKKSVSTA